MESAPIDPKIAPSWKEQLINEFGKSYFADLKSFLKEEKKNQTIYPRGDQFFSAFNRTPFDAVKVVILGQDPYHNPGQANGLSFSVATGIKPPPSLQNIFKELKEDLGIPIPSTGNLEPWADQGVLLLNATLSVRKNEAGSHQGKGWEQFTDAAIKQLSNEKEGLIFILWGRFAQNKLKLIDTSKHHIVKSPHPSPFSAYTGFFGSKPFSRTNEILTSLDKEAINWALD